LELLKRAKSDQDVDVAAPVEAVRKALPRPSEEEARDALLHVFEPEDGRRDRPGTNVMICKIFSPKKSSKKWRFWLKTELNCAKI
jgi:hypothetical protein